MVGGPAVANRDRWTNCTVQSVSSGEHGRSRVDYCRTGECSERNAPQETMPERGARQRKSESGFRYAGVRFDGIMRKDQVPEHRLRPN